MERHATALVMLGFLTAVTFGAQAQTVGRETSVGALRDVFRSRQAVNMLMLEKVPTPPAVAYTLTLSPGYTDAGSGASITSLPAEFAVNFNDGKTVFLLDGEYDWNHAPGANVHGWGDPSATVIYRLTPKGIDTFAIAGSVAVPSGTKVSAGAAAQSLALLWNHSFASGNDSTRATIEGDHVNGEHPTGVSAYAFKGKLYYQHDFAPDAAISDVFLTASYSHTNGAGKATAVGGGIDFPITREPLGPFKNVGGTLLGSCKIAPTGRCGHVEFDLNLPFK
jgi:hypothetical protein